MVLSFSGRANIGVRKVLEKYPDAKFLEAQGEMSDGRYIKNPNDLEKTTVVFHLEGKGTVLAESTGYSEFGEPYLVEKPWFGAVEFNFTDVKMDSNEAFELKIKAGFDKSFNGLYLFHPLNATITEPHFVFNRFGSFVFVNTVTKKVFEDSLRGLMQKN